MLPEINHEVTRCHGAIVEDVSTCRFCIARFECAYRALIEADRAIAVAEIDPPRAAHGTVTAGRLGDPMPDAECIDAHTECIGVHMHCMDVHPKGGFTAVEIRLTASANRGRPDMGLIDLYSRVNEPEADMLKAAEMLSEK